MTQIEGVQGVWRTIGGRRVFIKTGQSLSEAMKESGKFKNLKNKVKPEDDSAYNDPRDAIMYYLKRGDFEKAEKYMEKYGLDDEKEMFMDGLNNNTRQEYYSYLKEQKLKETTPENLMKKMREKGDFKDEKHSELQSKANKVVESLKENKNQKFNAEDEAFIKDLTEHYDEFTRGDLQGTIEAKYGMGEKGQAILKEVDDRTYEKYKVDTLNNDDYLQANKNQKYVNEDYQKQEQIVHEAKNEVDRLERRLSLLEDDDTYGSPDYDDTKYALRDAEDRYREEKAKYDKMMNQSSNKGVKTLNGDYERDNKGRIVSQKEYDDFREAYRKDLISKEDYRNDNYDALKENKKTEAQKYYEKLSEKDIANDLEERKNRLDNNFYDEKDKEKYQKFYEDGKKYYKEKYNQNLNESPWEKRKQELLSGENQEAKRDYEDYKKSTNEIMNDAIREKATKKTTYKEDLPHKTEIKTQGTSNRKEVSENIQAHILEHYDTPQDFIDQMDAMDYLPTKWRAGEELAKGGSYLIYNGDMQEFLNELKINPKGKKFSDDKAFSMYTSLIGRESEKLYNRLQKNAYQKYLNEHPASKITFEDFKDMKK